MEDTDPDGGAPDMKLFEPLTQNCRGTNQQNPTISAGGGAAGTAVSTCQQLPPPLLKWPGRLYTERAKWGQKQAEAHRWETHSQTSRPTERTSYTYRQRRRHMETYEETKREAGADGST